MESRDLREIQKSLFAAFENRNVIRIFTGKPPRKRKKREVLEILSGDNIGEAVVWIRSEARDIEFCRATDGITAYDSAWDRAAYDIYTERTITSWRSMLRYLVANNVVDWRDVKYFVEDEF